MVLIFNEKFFYFSKTHLIRFQLSFSDTYHPMTTFHISIKTQIPYEFHLILHLIPWKLQCFSISLCISLHSILSSNIHLQQFCLSSLNHPSNQPNHPPTAEWQQWMNKNSIIIVCELLSSYRNMEQDKTVNWQFLCQINTTVESTHRELRMNGCLFL